MAASTSRQQLAHRRPIAQLHNSAYHHLPDMAAMTEDSAMSDMSMSFRRAGDNEYAFRVPTPPRIVVPPPAHNTDMTMRLTVKQINSRNGNAPNMGFLTDIGGGRFAVHNSGVDWTYEKRRQAQEVAPYIYLGPHSAAKERDFLVGQGVTMLLGVLHERTPVNAARKIASELGIEFLSIGIGNNQELISTFPKTTAIINQHLANVHDKLQLTPHPSISHGKVFVFCESGNERSASIIVAWMMEMLGLDFIKAMQLCQCQRFCVNFDDNLKYVLRSYGDILDARRQVASCANGTGGGPHATRPLSAITGSNLATGSKRGLDTEDTDMGGGDDDDRFQGRHNAPFQDADDDDYAS